MDQSSARAPSREANIVDDTSEHPAKAVMARRWEQRRAQASARWTDVTSSVVIERSAISGAPQIAADSVATGQHLLEDMRQLELKDAADSGVVSSTHKPAWLSNTTRAMLLVVLVSHSVLLGLLYFGGFLP